MIIMHLTLRIVIHVISVKYNNKIFQISDSNIELIQNLRVKYPRTF